MRRIERLILRRRNIDGILLYCVTFPFAFLYLLAIFEVMYAFQIKKIILRFYLDTFRF